jgi:hypothetical protein
MKKKLYLCTFGLVLAILTGSHACECGNAMLQAVDQEKALVDSLNIPFVNDIGFLPQLKDSVANARICFVGYVQALKKDTTAYNRETLYIACDRKIKGTVPASFKIINIAGSGDCVIGADSLVGKKFLCILASDTLPGLLRQLGVFVADCGGGLQGYFVTEKRIVTFYWVCWPTGPLFYKEYVKNASFQEFLDETSIRIAPGIRNKNCHFGIAQSRFGAFLLNGKAIGARNAGTNSASQAIIKNGNKIVGIDKKELR